MAENFAENALLHFNSLTKKPENFLSDPSQLIDSIHESIKLSYDFTKSEEENNKYNSLRQLIVKDFDVEQIWQQLELQNNKFLDDSLHNVCKLVAAKDTSLWFTINEEKSEESEQEEIEEDSENNISLTDVKENLEESEASNDEESIEQDPNDSEFEDSNDEKEETSNDPPKRVRGSIVDDAFFKLDDMEKFLRFEEKEKPKRKNEEFDASDEESVDLFEANNEGYNSEDETQTNPRYNDFFSDGQKEDEENSISKEEHEDIETETNENELDTNDINKNVTKDISKILNSDDEASDENEDKLEEVKKSSLEIREERLQRKIEQIEDAALREKSWQLKGEVTASKRPQNSLLEEVVEFDLTTRPAPVITQETTFKLEDVIKQRIKDKAFDSVERKIKPVDAPTEYRKKLVLDQEKSKQSLAQIYETEFIKQKESLDPETADKEEEIPKEHLEIKTLMKTLFTKLDALANFHFTPKIMATELKVVSNLPAISMEEVAPLAVSDATLLAPEEINKKPKGDLIGRGERTDADKKRERRQKRRKQKKHAIEKQKMDANTENQSGNKFTKKKAANLLEKVTKDRNVNKMNENAKTVKSSTAFFTQLEEEVKGHIKSKEKRKHKLDKPNLIAKKMKL